jgi:hypothetical protein
VVGDEHLSRVDVHVDELNPQVLLELRAAAVDPGRSIPSWVHPRGVFLHLNKGRPVLVNDDQIDWIVLPCREHIVQTRLGLVSPDLMIELSW